MYSARSRNRIAFEIPAIARTRHVAMSLLRGGHGDTLATLRSSATQDLAATTGLLARAKPVGALAALVMRLVGALHGWSSCCEEQGPLRGGASILDGLGR